MEFLLKAWQAEGTLWIVGAGPDQERLQSMSRELNLHNCCFLGATDAPLDFYQAADIFVFPSLKEGAPNAVLEAMSCALPVVATRTGGVVDYVRHDQEGLLVSPASPAELSAAMRRAAEDSEARARWGGRARQTACEHFDIAKTTSEYLNLYGELSARSS